MRFKSHAALWAKNLGAGQKAGEPGDHQVLVIGLDRYAAHRLRDEKNTMNNSGFISHPDVFSICLIINFLNHPRLLISPPLLLYLDV